MGKPSRLFWFVGVAALAANLVVAADSFLANSGLANSGKGGLLGLFTAEFIAWATAHPVWRVALHLTAVISGVIGSALLLMRRKEATATLSFALILMTLGLAGDVLVLDGLKHASVHDLAWSAARAALFAVFAWYAARAASKAWLR